MSRQDETKTTRCNGNNLSHGTTTYSSGSREVQNVKKKFFDFRNGFKKSCETFRHSGGFPGVINEQEVEGVGSTKEKRNRKLSRSAGRCS